MFFVHWREEGIMAARSIDKDLPSLDQLSLYLGNITGHIEHEFDETAEFDRHFVETLERYKILVGPGHGYHAFGRTAAEAFFRSYYLRQTCSAQVKTLWMGHQR